MPCFFGRALMAAILLGLLTCAAAAGPAAPDDDLGTVTDFSLTERSGKTVRRGDLEGKVWVAAFIFTRCAGPCAQVSGVMARLQHDLAASSDVVLVSFSVDPEYDTPAVLREYAKRYGADPERWLFLTGEPTAVYRLIREGFHLTAQQNQGADRTPGNEVMHDVRLALVDRRGHIRGYYEATDPTAVARLEEKIPAVLRGEVSTGPEAWTLEGIQQNLPAVNAALNALSAALLLLGYAAIRRREIALHKACMLSALGVSILFLACYLYYHLIVRHGQPTHFSGTGAARAVYFTILISHTLLAMATAPLALFTAYQGLRNNLARHVRVAQWTLPIWLYVSITGVIVYWMLYHLYPPS
jgi:protein SCO1/2